jgi:integrase
MSLYRRANTPYLWCRFRVKGREVRLSTGTTDRQQAEEFETVARSAAWRQAKLGERPPYPWSAARKRWLAETQKRTKAKDEAILRWFDDHLREADVQGITREVIDELRALKAEEQSQATADRYMALLRAILRKCVSDWSVLDSAPKVPMYRPRIAEPRFLTQAEFDRLVKELPEHLKLAARFAVLTGLRMRSMLSLEWGRVDLKARRAWVPGEQMKAGRTHGIPLSTAAVNVLKELRKLSPDTEYVFTWKGEPVDDCNGRAFKEAVKRAGFQALRWHDLRHTWASWAVQNGVTLHELMQLGGWSSYQMVLRYAHLAPDHLAEAAEKVSAPGRIRASRGGAARKGAGGRIRRERAPAAST